MTITKPGHWFNKNIYYLGELCPKYHQWGTANFSLRNIKTNECAACKSYSKDITQVSTYKRVETRTKKLAPKVETHNKIDLFNRQIDKSTECWIWTGKKNKAGYGHFYYKDLKLAHRVSYLLHYGDFDKSLFVCHKCDNPSCVNPGHLFLGTAKDNFEDMINKGRNKISALMIANKRVA